MTKNADFGQGHSYYLWGCRDWNFDHFLYSVSLRVA